MKKILINKEMMLLELKILNHKSREPQKKERKRRRLGVVIK